MGLFGGGLLGGSSRVGFGEQGVSVD
jgi:hypothetical protein